MGMCARVLHVAYNDDRDARDDCDAHARDDRYAGSTRAARQRSGEGREAGEAVAVLQARSCEAAERARDLK